MSRSPGSVPTPEHAAGMGQEAFAGRTAKEKWREHMRENPYKRLPPVECKQDGSLYRMTPTQRKQANALIRRECCCYEDGNCMLLDLSLIHIYQLAQNELAIFSGEFSIGVGLSNRGDLEGVDGHVNFAIQRDVYKRQW